jgi:hypothetical protein
MKFYGLREQKVVIGYSPKCGSTGLAHWIVGGLLERQDIAQNKRIGAARLFLQKNNFVCMQAEASNLVCKENYRFIIFVRDPYSRIASVYIDKFVFRRGSPLAWGKNFEGFAESFVHKAYAFMGRDISEYSGLSFDEFLAYISHCRKTGVKLDNHWAPQVAGISKDLRLFIRENRCFFVRQESYDSDLQKCNQELGCTYESKRINENKHPENWSPEKLQLDYPGITNQHMVEQRIAVDKKWLLNEKTRSLIAEIYADDFRLLNYAVGFEP